MDEEQGKPEPKISIIEILIIGPVLVIFDAIGILLIFIGLDDFFILDILNGLVVFYFYIRGVSATRYLVTSLLELIPYVGVLPNYTLGFILTVYLDRHPELEAVVGKATKAVSVARGGVGGRTSAAGGAAKGEKPGGATGPVREEAGATARPRERAGEQVAEKPAERGGQERPAGREIKEEQLGMPTEPLQEVRETMEQVPEPNVVDLRTARGKQDEEDGYRRAA